MGDYFIGSDRELYHYGVTGMKWGVRRYQNPDGSFTADGKRRYQHTTQREDIAKAQHPGITNRHRRAVMAKYESRKTDAQKRADITRDKAYDDYRKYVENYSRSNKDTQTRYEHDFDHTKKGRKLIRAIISSDEVRQKAYEGAEWYGRYAKEMERATNRDTAALFR